MPARGAIGGHQSARSQTNTWLTPPKFFDVFGPFDLDPCAAPSPRPWPSATRMIELPEDGLAAEWDGYVWLNPPFANELIPLWMKKLADHGNGMALVTARTETRWFVEHVWPRASAIRFLTPRVTFYRPDGTKPKGNSGAPQCLVAYGARAEEALVFGSADFPGTTVIHNQWDVWAYAEDPALVSLSASATPEELNE